MSNSIDIKAKIVAVSSSEPYAPPGEAAAVAAQEEAQRSEEAAQEAQQNLSANAGKWKVFGPDTSMIPEDIIEKFDKAITTLGKVTDALTPILNFLEFFLSSFNSFSSLIGSLLDRVQKEVNEWSEDLAGAGIFFNPLFPPALNKNMINNNNWQKLSTGGFDGFLSRLDVSLRNTADDHRPRFSRDAQVGGLIIMVDSESADDFFSTLNQLANLFDILNLVPINLSPPPPKTIRSYPVYTDEDGYGIHLKWDAPGIPFTNGFYRISRSVVPGGIPKEVNDIPTKLGGKDGFIRAIKTRLSTYFSDKRAGKSPAGSWPTKTVYAYDDPTFNGPHIVKANVVNGSGSYLDRDIPLEAGEPLFDQFYYTVESGFPGLWGPPSREISVTVQKKCVDPDSVAVVTHAKGYKEYISAGWGGLGQWSSIQTKFLIPFMPLLIEQMNKVLDTLKGMVKNNSDSFSDFIKGIKDKIDTYIFMIDLLTSIVEQVQKMILGPSAAFLVVPPEKGGISGFMQRVRSAKVPDDGFSGQNGMTGGLVFIYGAVRFDTFGNTDEKAIAEQSKAISKAFSTLVSLLTGGSS